MIITFWYVDRASAWAYVDPARLSGMMRESVVITGPVGCLAATWVAERFTNRRSPLAVPTAVRATGGQGLTILWVLLLSWCAAQVIAGAIATLVQFARATGGTLYPLETAFGVASLAFLIATGFVIGVVVARWHALIWSAVWCLFWIGVVPVYGSTFLSSSRNSVDVFVQLAPSAVSHDPIRSMSLVVPLLWWLLVLGAVALLLLGWFRRKARVSAAALAAGSIAMVICFGIGAWLPAGLPGPYRDDGEPRSIECTSGAVRICLTAEQRPLLAQIVARSTPVIGRVGKSWPADLTTIASSGAAETLARQGVSQDQIVRLNVSSYGANTVEMDIGTALSGLPSCSGGTSDQRSAQWAFSLGSWISQDDRYLGHTAPEFSLDGFSDVQIFTWYRENAAAIRDCRYDGPGPA